MSRKAVATNRKARHEYDIEEVYEAGVVLLGPEVKSLRAGRCSIKDGFALVRDGEVFLRNVHIAPYKQNTASNMQPDRERRLLLHRREIRRLTTRLLERGYTLVPLRVYFKRGYAKVELGLAKGRKQHDKRQRLRERDAERRAQEELKKYSRGQSI